MLFVQIIVRAIWGVLKTLLPVNFGKESIKRYTEQNISGVNVSRPDG